MSPLTSKAQWRWMASKEPAMFNRWVKHTKKKYKQLPNKVNEEFKTMTKINRGAGFLLSIYKNPTPTEWRKYMPKHGARGYIDPDGNLFMEGYEEGKVHYGWAIHYDIGDALKLKYDPFTDCDPERFGMYVQESPMDRVLYLAESYDDYDMNIFKEQFKELFKKMQEKNPGVNWYFDDIDSRKLKKEGMLVRKYEAYEHEVIQDMLDGKKKKIQRRSYSADSHGHFRLKKDVQNIDDNVDFMDNTKYKD